jgi:hypothetical protein
MTSECEHGSLWFACPVVTCNPHQTLDMMPEDRSTEAQGYASRVVGTFRPRWHLAGSDGLACLVCPAPIMAGDRLVAHRRTLRHAACHQDLSVVW